MNKLEKLYTVQQIGEMFSVNTDTVYEWVYMQCVDAYNINGLIRISENSLKELMQECIIIADSMYDFSNEDVDYFPEFLKWAKLYDKESLQSDPLKLWEKD
ncbi:helix-turn-helix domain-containing protein [Bacillus sp. MUM 13]|uniref:helix-turn-helix domain-containing protein n=1 Tax=Bacillus sp. MUM 13 TaxID=1678001 RepID=UPI0008F5D495|nr:helix-turn-helix domain-containing protein [Bacillus sp. MUM 13]OIK08920.1 hypothetical protein BIV59_18240 [Bacillus sp. MUM 13]